MGLLLRARVLVLVFGLLLPVTSVSADPIQVQASGAVVVGGSSQSGAPGVGGIAGAQVTVPVGAAGSVSLEGSLGATSSQEILGSAALSITNRKDSMGSVGTAGIDCTNPAICTVGALVGLGIPLSHGRGNLTLEARLPGLGGAFYDRTASLQTPAWAVAGARVGLEHQVGDLVKLNAFLEGDVTGTGGPFSPNGAVGLQGVGVELKVSRHLSVFGNLALVEQEGPSTSTSNQGPGTGSGTPGSSSPSGGVAATTPDTTTIGAEGVAGVRVLF